MQLRTRLYKVLRDRRPVSFNNKENIHYVYTDTTFPDSLSVTLNLIYMAIESFPDVHTNPRSLSSARKNTNSVGNCMGLFEVPVILSNM